MTNFRAAIPAPCRPSPLPALPRPAFAQAYPTRPVKLVVPFTAGGTTDLIARILAQSLIGAARPAGRDREQARRRHQHRRAVGGELRRRTATRCCMTVATNTINPSLYKSLPFDFQRDIAPVSGLAELPLVLVGQPGRAGEDRHRVRRLCQGQSGQDHVRVVRCAHDQPSGDRAAQDVDRHRVRARAVSGRRRRCITDLISGRIQAGIDALPNSLPHIRSGAVRALAVMSPQRNPAVPDVPTMQRDHSGPRDQRRDGHRRACGDARPRSSSASTAISMQASPTRP